VSPKPGVALWPGRWAVCRLSPESSPPPWSSQPSPLTVIARTAAELSIVAPEGQVPEGTRAERGFRVLAVDGPIPFSETGLVASLTGVLAEAGVSVFPIATYDTDYLLIRDDTIGRAVEALRRDGWSVAAAPQRGSP
jgi:uncharacterized protein